jgi:hypothetical protein
MSDVLDLYANGFSVKNNLFQLILKGVRWEYRLIDQTEQKGTVIRVTTSSNHFTIILRENNYTIHIQDQTELYIQHILTFTTFDILKKHIFELCTKK